ncbi:MAG: glycosyltransferase [Acidobacteria bacterium]|nr:glycosyltransferase [Acidobacteriota bacterium]
MSAPQLPSQPGTGASSSFARDSLSIVIPVYNEREVLVLLFERLGQVLPRLGFDSFEVVLVSDGSRDGSDEVIAEKVRADSRYCGVFLSRNFGHQAAVWSGLGTATGNVIAVMDADLQDPPEVLARLIDELEAGADVAYGVRRRRQESLWKRAAYKSFYRLLAWASPVEIPLDSGDFSCMRREVVDAMRELPEQTRFIRGLRAWVGFDQRGVEYDRPERSAGATSYTIRRLVELAYDGIFTFSTLPVRIVQLLGFVASAGAISVAAYYTIWYFIDPTQFPSGFATITISLWLLSGIQLLFLGIVGEYVVRGLQESRGRPAAVIRQIFRHSGRKDE